MAVPYNHKAIEAKWRVNWEKNPVNVNDGKNTEILLSGYVSVSVRQRSPRGTLERLCDL